MELRQIRCFLAVAELRHFGRAAEQLHVVQPAVSQQVRRLEQELGVQLFHRTTRTVELTGAGLAFLERAREIAAAVDRASQTAQQEREGNQVFLRVATGSGLGSLLGAVLEDLRHGAHDLNVQLVRLPEQERLERLADGRLDAAIIRDVNIELRRASANTRIAESLVAALPATQTTARRRTIRLADLAAMPARLPERHENPALLDALVTGCRRIGVNLKRIPAGADEDMLALIANGPPSWTSSTPRRRNYFRASRYRPCRFAGSPPRQ